MRVGLVIYGNLNTVSGGYLYDRKLVEHLQHAGEGVEIISLPLRNYVQHLTDNALPSFHSRLRDAQVDVLLQDELNHPSLFLVNARLRAQVRFPILSIVHHPRCLESHPGWLNLIYRLVERRYLASVDGFILNSETTRQAVCKILGRSELPNSVVAYPAGDRFHPQITQNEIAARAMQSKALRIVFVGNLIRRKGLHTLLDALAQLPTDSWDLAVVGSPIVDAKYAQSIRKQIADHHLTKARILGTLSDVELAKVLTRSHVLAVPSDYEGFGIVYLEAMSFGLPAIATTHGAAREIITDGENGYLVPPDNPALLASRLLALQSDRALLTQMGLAARARFLAHPTWEESMKKIRNKLIELTQ